MGRPVEYWKRQNEFEGCRLLFISGSRAKTFQTCSSSYGGEWKYHNSPNKIIHGRVTLLALLGQMKSPDVLLLQTMFTDWLGPNSIEVLNIKWLSLGSLFICARKKRQARSEKKTFLFDFRWIVFGSVFTKVKGAGRSVPYLTRHHVFSKSLCSFSSSG